MAGAARRNKRRVQTFSSWLTRGEPSEAEMLLMYLPFVIYSASMQMFLDSLPVPVPVRQHDSAEHNPPRP